MRASLIIVLFFIAGLLCGVFSLLPRYFLETDLSLYALYLLLVLVGIGMGGNPAVWDMFRRINARIALVPLSVVVGTLLGTALFSFLVQEISFRESLAVVSGFGYYSLSSVIITELRGESLGVLALLSNIFREIATLLITPLLVRYFGSLAPIASGGATSMDTTLPIIVRFTGKEYGLISVFSGVVLTLLAPFLITFIL